ncbi:hypothetical protein [Anaerobiospirillum sp. NML120449]|uniref:hypothetical protein n=1 Tax=Anaerobiospirillum sp. NML120449 TaxID=2932817 RepID=UPI001FF34F9E|nr:hypothetical protein [Anaerobiospirillum sp. NML120449]MCK0526006.1 hypothetical protein [Anaerobiospirillum sp. NML120449]
MVELWFSLIIYSHYRSSEEVALQGQKQENGKTGKRNWNKAKTAQKLPNSGQKRAKTVKNQDKTGQNQSKPIFFIAITSMSPVHRTRPAHTAKSAQLRQVCLCRAGQKSGSRVLAGQASVQALAGQASSLAYAGQASSHLLQDKPAALLMQGRPQPSFAGQWAVLLW